MKAHLCAAGVEFKKEHDLLKMVSLLENLGMDMPEPEIALIGHVNHLYFRDFRSMTRYKARYPTDKIEDTGGVVPPQARLSDITHRIRLRALEQNERLNLPKN
jgi:hypothetical protein